MSEKVCPVLLIINLYLPSEISLYTMYSIVLTIEKYWQLEINETIICPENLQLTGPQVQM